MNRESDSSILCMGSLSSVERSDYNQSHLATTLYPHDGPDVGIRFHRRRRRVGLCIVHAGDMPAFLSSGAEDTNLFTEVLLPSGRSEQICPPRRFRSRLSVNMELGRVQNLGRRSVPSIRDTPHYPMPVDDRRRACTVLLALSNHSQYPALDSSNSMFLRRQTRVEKSAQ